MARYHLNKDGLPAICKAHSRPCPIGGDHYDSKSEALQAAEDRLEEEEELFPTHKKETYHVDASGAAAPCEDAESCTVKPFNVFTNVHSTDMDMIFGAAAAFRSSIGAMNAQGAVAEEPPSPAAPVAPPNPYTQQARNIRAQANVNFGNPHRPKIGDERVIDNAVHTWEAISGDGCRTTIKYGWRKNRNNASVPPPVAGEERTENQRVIRYEEDAVTGAITGRDVGEDNDNFSGREFGSPRPSSVAKPSYGTSSWAGGASYRC